MTDFCTLASEPFDPSQKLADFTRAASGCGAVASFTGIARALSKDGGQVETMFLDHHERLTLSSMQAILSAAKHQFLLTHACIIHRSGILKPNDPIVFVAAASAHRRAALDAVDFMMDHLKTEAVFWKRETTQASANWIEPTADDYAAKDRWI